MRLMNKRSFDIVSVDVGDCATSDLLEQVHGSVDNDWCLTERFEEIAPLICGVRCDVNAKGDAASEACGMEMARAKTVDCPIEVHETKGSGC